jgi:hypothetical protein
MPQYNDDQKTTIIIIIIIIIIISWGDAMAFGVNF